MRYVERQTLAARCERFLQSREGETGFGFDHHIRRRVLDDAVQAARLYEHVDARRRVAETEFGAASEKGDRVTPPRRFRQDGSRFVDRFRRNGRTNGRAEYGAAAYADVAQVGVHPRPAAPLASVACA